MLFRSDEDGHLVARLVTPEVSLDSRYYKTIQDFDSRILQAPSLREAESLRIKGDWTFEPDVKITSAVELPDERTPRVISARTVLNA